MSKTHRWFATKNDVEILLTWLSEAGARLLSGAPVEAIWDLDGLEFGLHFPKIGPVEYWSNDICLSEYEENSLRWRRAVMTQVRQQEQPHRPWVDADKSAVAGIQMPEFRDGRYWVSGEIWFPGSRLKETFPELNRVCARLERFLKQFSTVFDNRKGEDQCGFTYYLCMSGIMQKVVALPEANLLLQHGAFMVDSLVSPTQYAEFRRRLQLSGHEASG